ncbi:hypothetical protein ABS768_01735 [Flavobacterium sp. ST-75]|uniref:Uncharacterized protein n=1 Tax=Flavobacterium rhizophilum TaxID=3163296 RepID=A0ABW8Y7U1_9FLAO
MKIGVYLSGLGDAFTKESAEKYVRRFAREYDFDNPEHIASYQLHLERFEFDTELHLSCNRIVVTELKGEKTKVIYKFYEYSYAGLLTRNFRTKNTLKKTLLLFLGVCSKFPLMLFRLFYVGKNVGYRHRFRGQVLYLFLLFFIVSLGILILLPIAIAVVLTLLEKNYFLKSLADELCLNLEILKYWLTLFTNLTALLILLMPGVNEKIVSLACEFVSASDYLEKGATKQAIHGQLDLLIEQIINEEGSKTELYFHSYSFGTLICLDYIFPYGVKPSVRLKQHLKGLITIGSPIDFIKVYFPKFFKGRNLMLNEQLEWINVYSMADALASNFRSRANEGPAQYSFEENALKPINVRYEVANTRMNLISQFFTLYALKAHSNYWEANDFSQSCFRELIPVMKERNFL